MKEETRLWPFVHLAGTTADTRLSPNRYRFLPQPYIISKPPFLISYLHITSWKDILVASWALEQPTAAVLFSYTSGKNSALHAAVINPSCINPSPGRWDFCKTIQPPFTYLFHGQRLIWVTAELSERHWNGQRQSSRPTSCEHGALRYDRSHPLLQTLIQCYIRHLSCIGPASCEAFH